MRHHVPLQTGFHRPLNRQSRPRLTFAKLFLMRSRYAAIAHERLRTLRLDRIGRLSAALVAAALLLGSASFVSAQSERLPKVGYLGFGGSVPPTHFQNRMRELRYSEGKEVTVEYRFAGGRPGGAPAPRPRTRRCESGCHHGSRRRADRGRQERYAHRSDRDGRLRCGHHRLRREPGSVPGGNFRAGGIEARSHSRVQP